MTGRLYLVDRLTEEQLITLGLVVEKARLDKGWSKEEAAREARISSITWKRVEDGKPVQPVKLRGLENALGWAGGSAERVARGGQPVVEIIATTAPASDLEQRILDGPFSDVERVYLLRLVREDRARAEMVG